jgi:Protein of unknown function/AsmA-like C-terminal region
LILRVSKLLVRVLVLLVAVVALALGFFVWLLMTGPVSVAWLTPYLERELSTETASVEIDGTEVRLSADQALDLTAVGVRVRDREGRLLGELPEVEVGLSTSALLFDRRIAISRIDAVAPTLILARREDGSIGFGRSPSDQPDVDQFDVGAVLVPILTRSAAAGAPAYLEHIRFSGGELILEDQTVGRTLNARDAELNVDFLADRVVAALQFRMDQPARPAFVHVLANHKPGQDWIGIEIAIEGLLPAEFAGFAPDLPLSGVRLPLSGNVQSAVSLQGELAPIRFDLQSEGGMVELPRLGLGGLPIDAVRARGVLAADLEGVVVDQLGFASNGAALSGQGEVAWRSGAATLHADLEAKNATIEHVAAFWPPGEGREARAWVIENITGGVVSSARAKLRFGAGELGQKPLPEHTLAGEFAFEDLTVRYVDTMPPLVGVSGTATFAGQRMDFAVAGGHVGDLAVDHGSVVITGIGIKGRDTTQLEVATHVAGRLPQALSLIDQPPLGFASKIGIAPDAASGRVVANLRIGMPLHKDLEPDEEARIAADAIITDATLAGQPIDLSNGQLTLRINQRTAELAGEAVVQGVPVRLQVRETFDGASINRRYQVEGSPDAARLREIGVDLPITLEGEIGVAATVTETSAMRTAEITLDLTPAAIDVAQLNWRKEAGEPGTLTGTATLPADRSIQVTEFALASHDLHAEGSLDARIEPFRLTRLRLDQVRFGDTRATVLLRQGDVDGYDVRLDAQTLDLTPWLEREALDQDGQGGGTALEAPLRLRLEAERLIVYGKSLHNVAGDLVRHRDGWHSADLTGRLPAGGEFSLTLAPAGERQQLRLTSTDAGDLLQALHQTSRIEGGRLELDATISRQQPTVQAEGKLVARKFHVLDAPLLARLLTVASLSGIVNLLGGEGIAFEQLEAPFVVRNQVLQLDKGRVYGSQLGLTFQGRIDLATDTLDLEGTIVPLYGVNWTIGQIPIIGRLLRGSEGEGAFAMTYGMRGPVDEPTISVNPLSALAPGFLRDLFSGLREGTLEPPEMLPSHDD